MIDPVVKYDGLSGGNYRIIAVHQSGKIRSLALRLDLRNHSPTGFCWGYMGSGPAQAALAVLADYAGDNEAIQRYQQFKFDFLSKYPMNQGWTITSEQLGKWLNQPTED